MSAPRLATYDDLLALPEDVRAELIAGSVRVLPSVLPCHAMVQRALGRFVGGPFDDDDGHGGVGGWWILPEVDVRFGVHDVVRPDMAGWRRPRLPEPWDVRPIDVVPDWICEVVSPFNARTDRITKARLYLEAGVPAVWLVDPETRVLEALLREGERWVEAGRFGDGDVVAIFESMSDDEHLAFQDSLLRDRLVERVELDGCPAGLVFRAAATVNFVHTLHDASGRVVGCSVVGAELDGED